MTDLLGNLAIQGKMANQEIRNYQSAHLINQKNNLAQEIQIQLIEFKTKSFNNPQNVSRETLTSPILKKYQTTLQYRGDSFYFELHHMDENLCKSLTDGFAESYKIDNKNCQNVKIYYK